MGILPPLNVRSESGTTIIEVLTAVAISAIVISAMSAAMAYQSRSLADAERRMDLMVLKNLILQNIDCRDTLREVCVNHQPVLISERRQIALANARLAQVKEMDKDKAAMTAVAGAPPLPAVSSVKEATQAQWVVNPVCDGSGGLTLYYARKLGKKYAANPLNGALYTWKPLFEKPICQKDPASWQVCPAGRQVSAVNFNTGELRCQ